MQCGYCGTENPERAVFCKHCGRRLDGMALCSACGGLTPADGEFCVNCGSNRNAPRCAMPLRFPAAEKKTPRMPAAPVGQADRASEVGALEGKAGAILRTVAFWCAAAAALVGMIFVFLIGAAVSAADFVLGDTGFDLYYFFGEAYPELSDEVLSSAATMQLTGAVLGTLCSVAALAGTVGCFIWTIVRFAAILQKKTQKSLIAPAAATFLAFACGAAAFMFCLAYSATSEGVTMGFTLNGATVAGLALGGIALGAAVIVSAVSRGIAAYRCGAMRAFVAPVVCGAVVVALAAAAIGVLGIGYGTVSISAENGLGGSSTFGLYPFFVEHVFMAASQEVYDVQLALGVVCVVCMLAFAVLATLAGACYMDGMGCAASKRSTALSIAAAACAVVTGILMCVAVSTFVASLEEEAYTADLAQPIVLIVLGALWCAAAIVHAVLGKSAGRVRSASAGGQTPVLTEQTARTADAPDEALSLS